MAIQQRTRSNVTFIQANGSTLLRRAVMSSVASVAQVRQPPSEPAKSAFLRLVVCSWDAPRCWSFAPPRLQVSPGHDAPKTSFSCDTKALGIGDGCRRHTHTVVAGNGGDG